ncbi:hypothetical protein NWP21_12045 [Anabaenopsis sp. FSS-46]|uniref:hypothetical protein n=1 Tax=Anabaenopsis sp. FSS-46 TaxID=2971766 RepID=UPI0024736DB6|nr:hypothetical protein [Anabaenopsis sp. FSS-46]MDH6099558.1 hypothetical protein [Anabaenopsis sp. FSS-46]
MSQQLIDQKAYLIFDTLEYLNLQFRLEASWKITKNGLHKNRFILAIQAADNLRDKFLYFCKQMDIPDKYLQIFQQNLSQASVVYFGFEGNEVSCIYKVYLEFWDEMVKDLKSKSHKTETHLLGLGFKWNALDNTKGVISTYTCYPLLSVAEILNRISSIYQGYNHSHPGKIVQELINFAADRVNDNPFIYLEVSEENNPRKSFDLNFYKANIPLQDIYNYLGKMRQHYGINAHSFNYLYQQTSSKKLGHLSGGIDRRGQDFLTIYYEV